MTFASVPTLPKSSTLILDGFCPYIGRGIVFESDWGSELCWRYVLRRESYRERSQILATGERRGIFLGG